MLYLNTVMGLVDVTFEESIANRIKVDNSGKTQRILQRHASDDRQNNA